MILIRGSELRKPKSTFGIGDAQSVKNAFTAGEKGYDAGKKVSGIKRHVVVDINGLPLAVHVTTANISDIAGMKELVKMNLETFSDVIKFLLDGGYISKPFALAIKEICGADVEIAKRNELHKFAVLPKRWVVERTWSWVEINRRLWKNCEHEIRISKQMLVVGFLNVLLRRF